MTPEAQCGGPIAVVLNDDVITIDPDKKSLSLVRYIPGHFSFFP